MERENQLPKVVLWPARVGTQVCVRVCLCVHALEHVFSCGMCLLISPFLNIWPRDLQQSWAPVVKAGLLLTMFSGYQQPQPTLPGVRRVT